MILIDTNYRDFNDLLSSDEVGIAEPRHHFYTDVR